MGLTQLPPHPLQTTLVEDFSGIIVLEAKKNLLRFLTELWKMASPSMNIGANRTLLLGCKAKNTQKTFFGTLFARQASLFLLDSEDR